MDQDREEDAEPARAEPHVSQGPEEEAEPVEARAELQENEPGGVEQDRDFESHVQFTRVAPPSGMIEGRKMTALTNEMIENLVTRFVHRQEVFQDYVPEAASLYVLVGDKVRVLNLTYGTLCDPGARRRTGGIKQVFVVGKAEGKGKGRGCGKGKEKGDDTDSSSPSSGDWIMTEEDQPERVPVRTTKELGRIKEEKAKLLK